MAVAKKAAKKKTGPKPKKKADLRKPLPVYARKKNHPQIIEAISPIIKELDKE